MGPLGKPEGIVGRTAGAGDAEDRAVRLALVASVGLPAADVLCAGDWILATTAAGSVAPFCSTLTLVGTCDPTGASAVPEATAGLTGGGSEIVDCALPATFDPGAGVGSSGALTIGVACSCTGRRVSCC